jgi:two-component system, cell cycle sensor histidine kinase and response regulator CckA
MRRDSTGLKVEIAFSCLVALLIGVGWLGLSRMGQINASANNLFNERWEKLYITRQAASYFNSGYRIAIRLFLTEPKDKQETGKLVAQLKENAEKDAAAWKEIEGQPGTNTERELLGKVDAAGVPAYESLQRATSLLVNQNKSVEAKKVMLGETLPLLNKYRDAWQGYIEYEEDQMNQARTQTRTSYATVRLLSATLISLAIALAVCIAVFVTRRLSREMQERESAQSALKNLNEDLERKVAERTVELASTVQSLKEEVNERRARELDLHRLAAIVEWSDDAIVGASFDGIVTDWNAGAERMTGFSRGEIIGKRFSMFTPPELADEPLKVQSRLLEGESVVRYESVRKRKDGKLIYVAITASPLKDQSGRIVGSSAILRNITERKLMEDAHRRSEASFRSFVENAPYGILKTTPEGKIVQANPALVHMLGYASEQEVLGLNMGKDVYRNAAERDEATMWSRRQDSVQGVEVDWKDKNGKPFPIRCAAHVVRDRNGKVEFLEGIVEDVSERRAMELQLRQGQKMEAVGRLAGGIAHDFNNLLGVISGYAELMSEQVGPASDARNSVEQIRKAADRASSLTGQLLAFSRQQVLEAKILDINAIVEDLAKMLPRLLGEDIELQVSLDPQLGAVKADQGQIEQVIMNLAVNARDAMPAGGNLAIRTRRVRFDSEMAAKHPPMTPGDYALLSVSDTGTGMDKQTQTHIFEPFFTTKERGRGTGLGLATVYGFVKQIGGFVWVDSEPGIGSSFAIYLPVTCEKANQNAPAAPPATSARRGSGTVLLVEDEESLRTLTRSILELGGYEVLEACNGMEAVEIAKNHTGTIHLLLTDMVMPGMNGQAVAEKVGQLHPGIRVAYMSGYTGFSTRGASNLDAVVIAKPFTRNILLQKLIEALELEQKPAEI